MKKKVTERKNIKLVICLCLYRLSAKMNKCNYNSRKKKRKKMQLYVTWEYC